jgi:hypothetical protein
LLLAAVAPGALCAPIDEVPSGTVLGKDNREIAKGLMPDEILEFHRRGEYSNPILKLDALELSVVDPNMVAAAEKNRGKYDLA